MQIIHKLDDFLYTIFPAVKNGDLQALTSAVQDYYTYGSFQPKVSIENDWLIIEIDAPAIIKQETDYNKAVALCEKGRFADAKPLLESLIERNPANSEYHRILGQVYSEEGDQDKAIDTLIDSLRWDSKNAWALLLMGNILAKFKDDITTAMKYYDQALVANPRDNITLNNIGANLMQQGKIAEAKKYFAKALEINSNYPNTHFALGMVAEMDNDLSAAFDHTMQALKLCAKKDVLYQNAQRQAFDIAKRMIGTDIGTKACTNYKHKLEFDENRQIEILEDDSIPTAAKIEFAENHNRENHTIRFKPGYPAIEHLIMHELVHLDLAIQARKANENQLFVSTQKHKQDFIRTLEPAIRKLSKMGIDEKSIADYCSSLFDGINQQVFNAPIDLFIENMLYAEFPLLRPYQFISLYNLVQQGLKAVTDKKIVELSPADILSKSKIYNMVGAMQFRDLYGLDFTHEYSAKPAEMRQATAFYDEYLDYKNDKEPGEEYEMVLHWAEDLKLDKYFELINEQEYRTNRLNMDQLLDNIEKDPYGLESKDPAKEREMEKFLKSQNELGTNMAVVMFMVDALQFFEQKPTEEIKKIAFEIAMQGTQGYNPDMKDYSIGAIPGKLFSGYHILAYYYVSWALAIPEMLPQLQ